MRRSLSLLRPSSSSDETRVPLSPVHLREGSGVSRARRVVSAHARARATEFVAATGSKVGWQRRGGQHAAGSVVVGASHETARDAVPER
jgi:hypothetical protein